MGEVFLGSEALAAKTLTEYELRRWYRSIFPDVYVPKRGEPTLRDRTVGAWLWSGRRAVIAGAAASALHGARWVDADTPIELVAPNARPHLGLIVRNESLASDETIQYHGLPVTTVTRTAFDLGRHLPRGRAVARLDALMHATPFDRDDVYLLARRHRGARGLRRLRVALPLVDGGADSPRETWLRLLFIDAGLPTPTTQIPLYRNGYLAGVFDMGWEEYQVAAEYDGEYHFTNRPRIVRDITKIAIAHAQGWIVQRVVSQHRPKQIVGDAYRSLVARGWRPDRRQRAALSRFFAPTSISALAAG